MFASAGKSRKLTDTGRSTAQSAGAASGASLTNTFRVTADLYDDVEEKLAILICLIDDFNEIRNLTQQLSSRYREGELDLVTVSLAINSALEMAQASEKEASEIASDPDEMENLLGILWAAHCIAQKHDPAMSLDDDKTPEIIYEIASSFFWPLRLILRGYLVARPSVDLLTIKPNYYGRREVLGAHSRLKARQKFHVDKMVLTDVLSHFDVIARIGENRPDYDEVTAGICSMFETGNIPLWLTPECGSF